MNRKKKLEDTIIATHAKNIVTTSVASSHFVHLNPEIWKVRKQKGEGKRCEKRERERDREGEGK